MRLFNGGWAVCGARMKGMWGGVGWGWVRCRDVVERLVTTHTTGTQHHAATSTQGTLWLATDHSSTQLVVLALRLRKLTNQKMTNSKTCKVCSF